MVIAVASEVIDDFFSNYVIADLSFTVLPIRKICCYHWDKCGAFVVDKGNSFLDYKYPVSMEACKDVPGMQQKIETTG